MAQFQILCPHSENEWRPITIDFRFAPTGDQQYLWPSFEEAEAARRQLLANSPGAQLRIALAGADIGDVDWPTREKLRFADGKAAWYMPRNIRSNFRKQMINNTNNSNFSYETIGGKRVMVMGEVPVRRVDALKADEARVV